MVSDTLGGCTRWYVRVVESIEVGTPDLIVDVQFKLNELGDDASIGCRREELSRVIGAYAYRL
jgi:hypothetical protein